MRLKNKIAYEVGDTFLGPEGDSWISHCLVEHLERDVPKAFECFREWRRRVQRLWTEIRDLQQNSLVGWNVLGATACDHVFMEILWFGNMYTGLEYIEPPEDSAAIKKLFHTKIECFLEECTEIGHLADEANLWLEAISHGDVFKPGHCRQCESALV